jgi:translation initiation factor 3 subunit G
VNGVKEITTYRTNELGQQVKVVQKVKVTKKTVKVSKPVMARRQWAKFGVERGSAGGYHGTGFTNMATGIDINEQTLDMMPKVQMKEEQNESAQRAFEKMNASAFEAWRPKQRDTSLAAAAEWAEANGLKDGLGDDRAAPGGAGAGSLAALAARGAGASGYIPPSMRNTDGTRNTELPARDDSCTVRVSNLSEDVKDSDLRELFRRFGGIQRIYLAKVLTADPSARASPALAATGSARGAPLRGCVPRRCVFQDRRTFDASLCAGPRDPPVARLRLHQLLRTRRRAEGHRQARRPRLRPPHSFGHVGQSERRRRPRPRPNRRRGLWPAAWRRARGLWRRRARGRDQTVRRARLRLGPRPLPHLSGRDEPTCRRT